MTTPHKPAPRHRMLGREDGSYCSVLGAFTTNSATTPTTTNTALSRSKHPHIRIYMDGEHLEVVETSFTER